MKKRILLSAAGVVCAAAIFAGCSGSGAAAPEEIKNIDFQKIEDQVKADMAQYYDYVRDVSVIQEGDDILISAVVDDSISTETAYDLKDTLVRSANSYAKMQDDSISAAGADNYGGLYDRYNALIGIAPNSKVDNTDEWFVYDAITSSAFSGYSTTEATTSTSELSGMDKIMDDFVNKYLADYYDKSAFADKYDAVYDKKTNTVTITQYVPYFDALVSGVVSKDDVLKSQYGMLIRQTKEDTEEFKKYLKDQFLGEDVNNKVPKFDIAGLTTQNQDVLFHMVDGELSYQLMDVDEN